MQRIPPEIREYVDETGLLLEANGLPRSAGQVLAWMLVCEPEQQSLNDLTSILGISKASASTMTRFLLQIGLLERTLAPGDRRDYYRISRKAWQRFFRSRIELMRNLRQNAEHGLHVLQTSKPKRRERLQRMLRLYSFLEREMGALLDRFEVEEVESAPMKSLAGQRAAL